MRNNVPISPRSKWPCSTSSVKFSTKKYCYFINRKLVLICHFIRKISVLICAPTFTYSNEVRNHLENL